MLNLSFPVLLSAMAVLLSPHSGARTVPAFPGAEGFGALATGGRGGEIYHVRNLEDAGPGSLRDALGAPHRLVVFDVGGIIRLKSNLASSSDLTILGQTAPGEGVTVYGRSISFSGCSNVIVRYVRFREGINGDRGKCSVNIAGGSDLILDHVSIEWGRWDCLGVTRGSHDLTVQNCLIGQGLDPQRFGALVDSVQNITISHNLWINNQSRNPKAKGAIQYINNVVYNWGVNGLVGGHSAAAHQLDVIGNCFIKGPSSNDRFAGMFTRTDKVFQRGNYVDLNGNGRLDGHLISDDLFAGTGGAPTLFAKPFMHPAVPVAMDDATTAWQKVVAGAGCSLQRDAVDRQLIAEVRSLGTSGKIVRNESELGGIGETRGGRGMVSSAKDGIPDAWKIKHHLDINDPNIALADSNHDGYCNLEDYANDLAARAR
jgi:pectate lyase